MKEVVKVSISGIAFSFDAEAYQVMKDYLDKLETGYAKKPDGREIVADIEARIAELILNEQESDNVVSRALAESVVAQLGFPDDLDTEEEPPVEKIPKRLYRNPDGAVLGGVCSGLAAYFRTDPVWIRLAFFLPMLLVIFPTGDASAFFGSMFIMFFLLKAVVFFIALGVGIAAIGCFVAIIAVLFSAELVGGRMVLENFSGLEGITPGLYAGLTLLAILIPLVLLGYFLLKVLFGSKTNRTFLLVTSVIWMALVVYLSVVTMHNADRLRDGARRLEYEIEEYDDFYDWYRHTPALPDDWDEQGEWKEEELRKDSSIDDLYREYREEDWEDDNVHVEITEQDGRVTIRKVVVHPDNPADTLSDERIVISRPGRYPDRGND